MVNKEIRIGFVRPSVGSEHEVSLELEAALVELDDDDDIGLAIPNVTFQVRIGVDNIFAGKSDAKFGVFKTPPIRIVNPKPELQIELTANDGVDTVVKNLRVNIATEIAKMVSADAIEAESKRRIKAEIREVQKRMKEGKAEIEQIRAAFGVLNKYSDHPLAAEVALEIAETHADSTVETYSHFKTAPWSEAVMFKAVEKRPSIVLKNIKEIKEAKWAAQIVSIIARICPQSTVDSLSDYSEMPWALQIMLQIAEENPSAALEGIENYEYQPWAKAVAEKATRSNYEAALAYYSLYKYQPWAQEIRNLAETCKRVEEKSNPGMASKRAEYIEIVGALRLLEARLLAEKNKFLCPDLDFGRVERTLRKTPTAIQTLIKAEKDGHEPTIYFSDETGFDIGTLSDETPESTRNCVFRYAKTQAAAMGWKVMANHQVEYIAKRTPSYKEVGFNWYAKWSNSDSDNMHYGKRVENHIFYSQHSMPAGWRGSLRVNFVDGVGKVKTEAEWIMVEAAEEKASAAKRKIKADEEARKIERERIVVANARAKIATEEKAAEEVRRAERVESEIHEACRCLTSQHLRLNPNLALTSWQTLSKYTKHQDIERTLIFICEQNPEGIITHFYDLRRADCIANILKKAIPKAPQKFMESIDAFIDEPFLPDLLEIVARSGIAHYVLIMDHLAKFKHKECALKVMLICAERNPHIAVARFTEYRDQPWAQIVRSAAEGQIKNEKEARDRKECARLKEEAAKARERAAEEEAAATARKAKDAAMPFYELRKAFREFFGTKK